MWGSPGGREMEGTNDCTVGRRQRPDIAHKASVKTKCTGLQEISTGLRNQSMVCLRFGYVLDHILLFRSFCVNEPWLTNSINKNYDILMKDFKNEPAELIMYQKQLTWRAKNLGMK